MLETGKAPKEILDAHLTLTVADYSALLGVHPETTYDAIRRGEIPAIRVGRRLAIPSAYARRLLQID